MRRRRGPSPRTQRDTATPAQHERHVRTICKRVTRRRYTRLPLAAPLTTLCHLHSLISPHSLTTVTHTHSDSDTTVRQSGRCVRRGIYTCEVECRRVRMWLRRRLLDLAPHCAMREGRQGRNECNQHDDYCTYDTYMSSPAVCASVVMNGVEWSELEASESGRIGSHRERKSHWYHCASSQHDNTTRGNTPHHDTTRHDVTRQRTDRSRKSRLDST